MKIIALLLIVCFFSLTGCERPVDSTTNSNSTPANRQATSEATSQPDSPAIPANYKEPSTRFANHNVFAASLQNVDKVRLFEGLPHHLFAGQLREQELSAKKTVNFHGFPFYEEPLELREVDATALTLFFRDRQSLNPYQGLKACGGFHPDYCIEWQVGQEMARALICFTCGETMLFSSKTELYCDIAEKNGAKGRLWGLLDPYQKNRPGPRVH